MTNKETKLILNGEIKKAQDCPFMKRFQYAPIRDRSSFSHHFHIALNASLL